METLITCAKWAAVIGVILLSPVVLIFGVPFGAGVTSDVLSVAGTPAALTATLTLSLAALLWTRYHSRPAPAPARRRHSTPKSMS